MKNYIIIILLAVTLFPLGAQGSFAPEDNIIGITLGGRMAGLEFDKAGASLFYAFAGRINLGVVMGFYADTIQSTAAQNIYGGAHFYTHLLSPYFDNPFSLRLGGSYFIIDANSLYLDNNNYTQSGNGYTLEMAAWKDLNSFRIGVTVLYEEVTTQLLNSGGSIITTESSSDFSIGALAGITLFPGKALSLDIEVEGAVTTGFDFKWGPNISLIVPR